MQYHEACKKLKYPSPSHALTHTHTTSTEFHTPAETLCLTCVDHSSRTSKCSVDNNISLSTCSLFAFPLSLWARHMYVLVARKQEFLTTPLWWKSLERRLVSRWVWLVWKASLRTPPPLTLHVVTTRTLLFGSRFQRSSVGVFFSSLSQLFLLIIVPHFLAAVLRKKFP